MLRVSRALSLFTACAIVAAAGCRQAITDQGTNPLPRPPAPGIQVTLCGHRSPAAALASTTDFAHELSLVGEALEMQPVVSGPTDSDCPMAVGELCAAGDLNVKCRDLGLGNI